MLDLDADHHVHTLFSVGSSTVDETVRAAERAGLSRLVVVDRAGPGDDWLAAHAAVVRRAARRSDVVVSRGVEVAVLDTAGTLALPAELGAVDVLTVSTAGFPLRSGPATPADVRLLLGTGVIAAAQLVELLAKALLAGLSRAAEWAQPVLARPFAPLAAVGLSGEVPDDVLSTVASGCLEVGAAVEVNERWRCPPVPVARALAGAGVPLVAGSSARRLDAVGSWSYVAEVAEAVGTPA
jgi:putative hydrolase